MSSHAGQDTGRLKEKCRQESFSPASRYLLCHCAPHLPDAYKALVIAFLWLEAQTLTSFIFRMASALITMLCASLFSSQPLITTGPEPKTENDELPRLRREAGGSENRGLGMSHHSIEEWVCRQYHLRHTVRRFLNYLICWPSNEGIKTAPTRGLSHVHISPPSEHYLKGLLKTHEGPKLVNRENKDASAHAGNFSSSPVWHSNQQSLSQIKDRSIPSSNAAQPHRHRLDVCPSQLHAEGQIAKDRVDVPPETLTPVRMALQKQGSPCHLPYSPSHGLYSKTWGTGKGLSGTRMYYAHAHMHAWNCQRINLSRKLVLKKKRY